MFGVKTQGICFGHDAVRPLADLHRHLDGSLRPQTVLELAADMATSVPDDLPFFVGMGLPAALSRFAFTLSLLQQPSAVRRVAAEMCEDAHEEGVGTLEIRFAPQLHKGALPEDIVDAALGGVAGRAGLILCGLYGESPSVLELLVEIAAHRPGVVGLDLAGGPLSHHRWKMIDYRAAFEAAGQLGMGRTVHAGEGRPPEEIRTAITVLGANRIGHGTSLLDDPSVVDLVRSRGVTIEACVTSNLHTGCIDRVEDHPLPKWLDAGVKVCICTDNTLLSNVNASEEHAVVSTIPGMTSSHIDRSIQMGHAAAFVRANA